MSFALSELSRLIAPDAARLGAIIATGPGNLVTVATQRGAMTVPTETPLAIGERVTIASGRAWRSPVAAETYPV